MKAEHLEQKKLWRTFFICAVLILFASLAMPKQGCAQDTARYLTKDYIMKMNKGNGIYISSSNPVTYTVDANKDTMFYENGWQRYSKYKNPLETKLDTIIGLLKGYNSSHIDSGMLPITALYMRGGIIATDSTLYKNHNDTIRVSMLVGIEGEPIKQLTGWMVLPRIHSFYYTEDTVYLDYRMHPLPKSYTVWMSKEIK